MRLASLLVVSILVLTPVTSFCMKNEPTRFKDVKWGQEPTEDMMEADMDFIVEEEGTVKYIRDGDNRIGEEPVLEIVYEFCEYTNRFMEVTVYFTGGSKFRYFKSALKGKWGKEDMDLGNKLVWIGNTTTAALKEPLTDDDIGFLLILNIEISVENNRLVKEKSGKSIDDF